MSNNYDGLVFNIQKFSIQDGPGIRTTVFLKGCPLICPWCSNPEGLNMKQEIITNDRKCIGCMKCAEACPISAISFVEGRRVIDRELCDSCLKCAEVCPSHSIDIAGDYMTVEEVFRVVAQDALFYKNSGGGVTLSGGEAMVQWEFALGLLKRCKAAGFHTALDTTAYCNWDHLDKVLDYLDLLLFDIKHMDSGKHKEKTGIGNELILENLEKAAQRAKVWVRIPLIPGYNDSEDNLRKAAELARRINAEKVSLLPYHEYGRQKYERLGKDYDFGEAEILGHDNEIVSRSKELFVSYGLDVGVGG